MVRFPSPIPHAAAGATSRGCARRRPLPAPAPCLLPALANGRRVLYPALGPEIVHATRDLERRVWPDIALEYLAVVADALEDAHNPVVVEADGLAKVALDADQPPDLGAGRFEHLIDVFARHP